MALPRLHNCIYFPKIGRLLVVRGVTEILIIKVVKRIVPEAYHFFFTSGRFTITSLTSGPCSPSHPCFLLRSPQPLLPLPPQLVAPCLTYFNVVSPPEILNVAKEDYLPTKKRAQSIEAVGNSWKAHMMLGFELPFYTSGI